MGGARPCCVCDRQGGKHCTKCKSRHYCGQACQLVDWKRGHKEKCKQLASEHTLSPELVADFQDRLLDSLMPEKRQIKEEPAIVEGVAPAAGFKAAPRAPAARTTTTAVVKASALNDDDIRTTATDAVKTTAQNDDAPDWRGICAICIDVLPVATLQQTFYECCCKKICTACNVKCRAYDERCPLCRALASDSDAEWLRRLQKHVGKGHPEAQFVLGDAYRDGAMGLEQSSLRAVELFELAAAQGDALAQHNLGLCRQRGRGGSIDNEAAARWYRRAAEQGHPEAQSNLGAMLYNGEGVAQSDDEAVKWFRLAAAQGDPEALYNLGACFDKGHGVPQDDDEALRLFKRALAKGRANAAVTAEIGAPPLLNFDRGP